MKVKGEKFHLTIENLGESLAIPKDKGLDSSIKERFGFSESFKANEIQRKVQGQLAFDSNGNSSLVPKPEDFYLFPFRLISATTVGAGSWKATDFSDENVLKKAVSLMSGKPAYKNHDLRIGSDIGTIGQCQFVPKKGDIPAGIDGPYVIDSVINPDLCRKMLSPVSPIQSSSVTVIFDWEASHEFENENDFYWHLGEMIDGTMVRRIVTQIHDFVESSLVYLGADPYAKMKDKNGNYINIDRSSILSNSKFDDDKTKDIYSEEKKYFVINSFVKENLLDLRKEFMGKENFPNENNPQKIDDMLKKELAQFLGCTEEEVTLDKLKTLSFLPATELETIKKKAGDLEAVVVEKETDIQTLNQELTSVKTERESLKAIGEVGTTYISKLREEAKSSYSKTVMGKVDEVIILEIEKSSDVASLEAKIKLFNGKLIQDFACSCDSCGSNKISFRSSEPDDVSKKAPIRTTHLSEQV